MPPEPQSQARIKKARDFYASYQHHETGARFNLDAERNNFLNRIRRQNQFTPEQIEYISRAFDYAATAHGLDPEDYGLQKPPDRDPRLRQSGDPYFIHPLAVALQTMEAGGSHEHVITALLHDVAETYRSNVERQTEIKRIRRHFGDRVADAVSLLTQTANESLEDREDAAKALIRRGGIFARKGQELLRQVRLDKDAGYGPGIKRLLDSGNMMAIWVKLEDLTHNLKTLDGLPPERRARVLRKYSILLAIARRLDAKKFAELHDLIWPGQPLPIKNVRGRVVQLPPRDKIDSKLILGLPLAEKGAIALYKPTGIDPRNPPRPDTRVEVFVGLPHSLPSYPQLAQEFLRDKLLAACDSSGIKLYQLERADKLLPSHAGNRAHYSAVIRYGDYTKLVRVLRQLHQTHLPDWQP